MSSRKSSTKSKGKILRKGRKTKGMKKKTGSKAKTKARTPTRRVAKRKREATAVVKAAAQPPVESPTSTNDDTIEEVRSSVEDIIDNAKKTVGVG